MDLHRPTRYPLHGRVQVALPNRTVVAGRTLDVAVGGICVLLDDQILAGTSCTLRFELRSKGATNLVTAVAKVVYGVFASQGGYRVGFQFAEADAERTALIHSLAGKKPMVAPAGKPAPEMAKSVDQAPAPIASGGD
jgi:hypothetical protein